MFYDSLVAVESSGFVRMEKCDLGPHERWLVADMKGRWVRLCPVVTDEMWAAVDDLEGGIVQPTNCTTLRSFRCKVATSHNIVRLIEEIDPPGCHYRPREEYRFLPDAEKRIMTAIKRGFPHGFGPEPVDDGTRNWLAERFIKLNLAIRWAAEGVSAPELTLGAVSKELKVYWPPYQTESESQAALESIGSYLEEKIAAHGRDYPARLCLG